MKFETTPSSKRKFETTPSSKREPSHLSSSPATSSFWPWLLVAVALGAAVRIAAVALDDRWILGGDGVSYHFESIRLADGLGYTSAFGAVGEPTANHPPGWVTVLGGFAWFGSRSLEALQLFTAAIGLGVIAMCGLVGRRYFSPRVGIFAAFIAALYPGFWLLETGLLSEPLGLLVLGCLTMVVANLRERPSLLHATLAGALCGLLALVRSEQVVLLAVVVVPVVLTSSDLSARRRAGLCGMAVGTALVLLAPWTAYNETRFQETVLLSANSGNTLLAGNCPPHTYDGDLMGFYADSCNRELSREQTQERLARGQPMLDRSVLDPISRRQAFDNAVDNIDRLPATVLARIGRAVAIFRPSQTVSLVAGWMHRDTPLVWAWVVSFWVLLPLAAFGSYRARRSGQYQWPLVAPAALALLLVVVAYGEPRYHSPADLGIIVLAAAGLSHLSALLARRRPSSRRAQPDPTSGEPIGVSSH